MGHWECDTVIGASHKGAVVTMVERKSGYAVMAKVSNKTSELVSSAIVDKLQPLAARVKTLTFDNGKEFARHAYIDEQLQSTAYFARPFASWERCSNENLNGLLRQYVPKKRAMSTVTDEEIRMIQNTRRGVSSITQARCTSCLNSPNEKSRHNCSYRRRLHGR